MSVLLTLLGKKKVKKPIYIKEFDVTKIEPIIDDESFTKDYCDKVLSHMDDSQYSFKERFSQEFYKHLNVVLMGAYVTGLNVGNQKNEDYINDQNDKFHRKLDIY